MAKKKPINRIIVAGAGVGVLLAVIVPVMIYVFGLEITINQQVSPEESFTIPFPVIEENEIIPSPELIQETIDNGQNIDEIPNIPLVTEEELESIENVMNTTVTSNDPPIQQIVE